MASYELSRLLDTAEALHLRYQLATKDNKNDDDALRVLEELEFTLVQVERQTRASVSVASLPNISHDDIPAPAGRSPLRALIYMWAGGIWTWVLVTCLEDQYPALKALIASVT